MSQTTIRKALQRFAVAAIVFVAIASVFKSAIARPNRYGHSDREERHMFPAVSSGPLDPAWSPDGKTLAAGSDDGTVVIYNAIPGFKAAGISNYAK